MLGAPRQFSARTLSITVFLAAAIWGLYWVPLRVIDAKGVQGNWSVALFNLSALAGLVPYVLWNKKAQFDRLNRSLLTGICLGLAMSFYATGLVTSTVIRATMLFYLLPVWSSLIGYFWLSEKINRRRALVIACGLVGLVLLLSPGGEGAKPLNFGDGLAFLSGLFWAIAAARLKRQPETPVAMASAIGFLSAAVSSAFFAITLLSLPLPSASQLAAALPFSLFCATVFLMPSVVTISWISQQLFPGRVGLLMMAEVLVAVLSASWFLPEEVLSPLQWGGAVLIISACVVEILASDNTQT